MFVGGGDDLHVANRAAGLDDGCGAGRRADVESVTEGEEGVGADDACLDFAGVESVRQCLVNSQAGAVYSAHLACTDAVNLVLARHDDGV